MFVLILKFATEPLAQWSSAPFFKKKKLNLIQLAAYNPPRSTSSTLPYFDDELINLM